MTPEEQQEFKVWLHRKVEEKLRIEGRYQCPCCKVWWWPGHTCRCFWFPGDTVCLEHGS